jgi:opacity protein-like surface antigen
MMFRNMLSCAALAASMVASAQQRSHWVVAKGAYTTFDSHDPVADKEGFGLGLGTWCADHLGFDLTLLHTDLRPRLGSPLATSNRNQFLGSFLFAFNPGGEYFLPYLAVGAGGTQIGKAYSDSHHQTIRANYHAGLGAQFKVSERFAITLDSKYVRTQTDSVRDDWVNTVGFGAVWGSNGF